MPLFGSRDVSTLLETAPTMPDVQTDALTIERVDILHVRYEIRSGPMLEMLPPALHPTLPPTVSIWGMRARGSDIDDFTMAQVCIGCRAGVRPRGFLLSCFNDNDATAKDLAMRWGFRHDAGTPKLDVAHHRTQLTVERDGRTILDIGLVSPEAISGNDVQFVANMNLAHTPSGPRLVQVDPEFVFHKADRGKPYVEVFDAGELGDDRIVLSWPVAASFTVADVTLPKLRYLCKVDVPAMAGTEPVV